MYNPLQSLIESVKDAITGWGKKKACMLLWVSYLMRWKGTPKMWRGFLEETRTPKKRTLSTFLSWLTKLLGIFFSSLKNLKPVTNPCSPTLTPHFHINYWKACFEKDENWLSICFWEESELTSCLFIVIALGALQEYSTALVCSLNLWNVYKHM